MTDHDKDSSSAAVVVAGGWQPIESAPRDESARFLVTWVGGTPVVARRYKGRLVAAINLAELTSPTGPTLWMPVLPTQGGFDEAAPITEAQWNKLRAAAPPSAEPPGQPRGVAPAGARGDGGNG